MGNGNRRKIVAHKSKSPFLSFSLDSKMLASASSGKTIKRFDVTNGKEVCAWNGHDEFAYSVAFSPDGRRLITAATDQIIKLWETKIGENVLTILYDTQLYGAQFNPNGKQVLTLPIDKTVGLLQAY